MHITRNEDGLLVHHWTIDEAAVEAERQRQELHEKILKMRHPRKSWPMAISSWLVDLLRATCHAPRARRR